VAVEPLKVNAATEFDFDLDDELEGNAR